ncbi:MAG: fumarylacetoacetate hydrolase family protein [Pseudomonadales bacterium]|nr:fumarylacetoacetate hydrolase family protein [Pseudomonadales bacterium]
MTTFVFEPTALNALSILGTKRLFPVNQIYCVGRNYADHAKEMGHEIEAPFFFMKPAYSLMPEGGSFTYPPLSEDVQHEVELVVALGAGGSNLSLTEAKTLIYGYGVGIDLTRRDLQSEAKAKSRPWDAGKSFLHAAPCSKILPRNDDIEFAEIKLTINGEVKQLGNVNQMIWRVPQIISQLSTFFPLYPGDIIFTGTPSGVGKINPGDDVVASIEGIGELKLKVIGNNQC